MNRYDRLTVRWEVSTYLYEVIFVLAFVIECLDTLTRVRLPQLQPFVSRQKRTIAIGGNTVELQDGRHVPAVDLLPGFGVMPADNALGIDQLRAAIRQILIVLAKERHRNAKT